MEKGQRFKLELPSNEPWHQHRTRVTTIRNINHNIVRSSKVFKIFLLLFVATFERVTPITKKYSRLIRLNVIWGIHIFGTKHLIASYQYVNRVGQFFVMIDFAVCFIDDLFQLYQSFFFCFNLYYLIFYLQQLY